MEMQRKRSDHKKGKILAALIIIFAIFPTDFLVTRMKNYTWIYLIQLSMITALVFLLIRRLRMENREKELAFQTDHITEGYNREGFLYKCEEIVNEKNFRSYAVIYFNVVNFRYVNETLGEKEGNRILNLVFQNLNFFLKEGELVCRSSMDHFFVLIYEEADQGVCSKVMDMVNCIDSRIGNAFWGYGLDFAIGACRLHSKNDFTRAMSHAIYASTVGTEKNKCIFYSGEVEKRAKRELLMDELFEQSIQNHDFQIYLQPKVSLKSENLLCSAEALVRWIHPEEGMIAPGEFIPLFEKNGKICRLDMYVLEECCRLVAGWIRDNKTMSKISVNLSRFHLEIEGLGICESYQEIKKKYHIPDGILEIELTETGLLEHNQLDFVRQILEKFRSCGFEVSLDDFGVAYSSLALLKAFDVDTLKLDREFFIEESSKSRKIVDGIIQMAHSLGMQVVAEGIEEQEQVETLRRMGCDFVQGYVYSRPLPIAEFEKWRAEHSPEKNENVPLTF